MRRTAHVRRHVTPTPPTSSTTFTRPSTSTARLTGGGPYVASAVAGIGVSEAALRLQYMAHDADIGASAQARVAHGTSAEAAARWAVQARNDAKAATRAWDLDALRLLAEQRNRETYGNPLGPDFDQLHTAGKREASAIIDGAARSNQGVDAGALVLGGVSVAVLAITLWLVFQRMGQRTRHLAGLLVALLAGWGLAKLFGAAGAEAGGDGLPALVLASLGAVSGVAMGAVAGRAVGGPLGNQVDHARRKNGRASLFWFLLQHRAASAPLACGVLATLVADATVLVLVAFTLKKTLASLTSDVPGAAVWAIALECLMLLLAKLAIDMAQASLLARAVAQTMQKLRARMFAHLQAMPASSFRETHFGVDTTALFAGNAQVIGDFLTHSAPKLAQNILLGVCSLAVMATLEWRLTLVCLAALLLTLPIPRLLSARLARALKEPNTGDARSLALVDDAVAMHTAMRVFNLAPAWMARFRQAIADAAGPLARAVKAQRLYEGSMVNLANFLVFVLIVAAMALSAQHAIAIDVIGAFFVLLQYVAGVLGRLGPLLAKTTRTGHAARAIDRFLDRPAAPVPGADAPPGASFDTGLDFDAVSFAYDAGHPVLDGVSFAVAAGESVALVGSSGSGKSSVLALLMREHAPQQGHVRVDQRDVADIRQADFSRLTSIISQDTRLFNLTVRENIRIGRLEASDAEVEDAARLAEAHAMVMSLPQAYDTQIIQYGANLSGGQRQRIAIARALVARPKLLLVDEATSALDATAEAAINEALARISRSCTVIQVTHRLRAAARASRILVLEAGRIVESGTHVDLLAQGGVYARLFEKQHAIEFDGNRPRVDTGLLRKVRLFAGVSDAVLAEMARCMMVERVPQDTVLFTEGSEGDKFYVVARGKLEVRRGEQTLAFLDDGDCFGEIALLAETPRNATVLTRADCLLLTLDRHQFRAIVGQDTVLRAQLGALVAQRSPTVASPP